MISQSRTVTHLALQRMHVCSKAQQNISGHCACELQQPPGALGPSGVHDASAGAGVESGVLARSSVGASPTEASVTVVTSVELACASMRDVSPTSTSAADASSATTVCPPPQPACDKDSASATRTEPERRARAFG
jgi:hypothetical protein